MRAATAALLLSALAVAAVAALPRAAAHAGMDGVASPLLEPGDRFVLVIDGAGTYAMACHLHADMKGMMQVDPSASPGGPATHRVLLVDGGADGAGAFRDEAGSSTVRLHAGDTVEWLNAGNATHDVHLVRTAAASSDNGTFEATVLAGLAVTLAGILFLSRRH
jgi:plastocyanin